MKKVSIVFVSLVLIYCIFVIFFILRPFRTKHDMEVIAYWEVQDAVYRMVGRYQYDRYISTFSKPIITNETNSYAVFTSKKRLSNGKDAEIYIKVYKNPFTSDWNHFWTSDVNMNYEWGNL